MTVYSYLEKVSGRSPCTASFPERSGGSATYKAFIGNDGTGQYASITTAAEIWLRIKELAGYCEEHQDGIRLGRTLPIAHPIYPWLFWSSTNSIEPLGRFTNVVPDPAGVLEAPTFTDAMPFYPCYEVTGTFTSRPYAIVQDSEIQTSTLTWTKPDGSVVSSVPYAKEWLRFVDVAREPGGSFLTAHAGQFKFDVASTQKPNNLPAGDGQLRMYIPHTVIKLTWFMVPFGYVDTVGKQSYIDQALGCVNQFDWFGYAAGTMLLDNISISRYSPWVPIVGSWEGSTAIFAGNKLCDITFTFLFLDPPLGKDESGASATPTAAPNANVINTRGWNLVPYAHRNSFFYAKTTGVSGWTDANNQPLYPSFPMELIWTNPNSSP